MSYLAEKYATLLSKDDVLELFQDLEELCGGNVSKACQKCGIQRKTKYDWIRTRSLKSNTKRKVLKTMVEIAPERTLNFLLSRSKETTVELLSTYLSQVYAKAMAEPIDPRSFVNTVKTIEKIKNEHAGLIWELEEELGDMMYHIKERAFALKVSLPEESVDMIKPSHLLEMIPSVAHAITRREVRGSPSELAINLKAPEKLVRVMSEAIMIPFGQLIEASQSVLPYKIGEVPPTANVEYPTGWGGNSDWVV